MLTQQCQEILRKIPDQAGAREGLGTRLGLLSINDLCPGLLPESSNTNQIAE